MSETSNLYSPMTSEDTGNATALQESLFGAMRSDSPAGKTIEKSGREAVPAQASRRQAKAKGLMMLVTSGLIGYDSSESASLQLCLENRLMTRLDTAGSTLFKLTWKRRRTPLGRSYLERAASVRRTSGKGFTSWPTPNVADHNASQSNDAIAYSERWMMRPNHSSQLAHTAQALCHWPTPSATDGERSGEPTPNMTGVSLAQHSRLTAWPTPKAATPSSRDWKDSPGMSETGINPDGSEQTRLDQLPRQVSLVASGEIPNGSGVEMKSTGQLNPEHSRWLMGLPTVFSSCADTAMQSMRKSRKRSSKLTGKAGAN
jgi:hypothetical protein